MILNLWSQVSDSPINAMHAGYGVGSIFAIYIARPFISFDPLKNNQTLLLLHNSTTTTNELGGEELLSPDTHINLRTPYWCIASVALVIGVLFVVAQYFEHTTSKRYEKNMKILILMEDFDIQEQSSSVAAAAAASEHDSSMKLSRFNILAQSLLFADKMYRGSALAYMLAQIGLFVVLFLFLQGQNTVIIRFMLTYLTLGPAKLDIDQFVAMQSLFWSFFVVGRLLAAYLAFKTDVVVFFFALLFVDVLLSFMFVVPWLASHVLFFWLAVPMLGLVSGPLLPSGLMIAKSMLNFNSFVLSLFIVGMGVGGVLFQQLTGYLLDTLRPTSTWMGFADASVNSAYVMPILVFAASLFSFLLFIPIYAVYKRILR